MAGSHISQALLPSKEAHNSDRIAVKSHLQNENPGSNSIHLDTRCLSEHNQVVLDHSAHESGVEMRSHMSDADMEDQQVEGQVTLSVDRKDGGTVVNSSTFRSEHSEEASYAQQQGRELPDSMDYSSQPPSAVQQQITSSAPSSGGYGTAESFSQEPPNEFPNQAGEQDTHGNNMIFQPQPSRGSSANSLLVQHSTYDEERRRLERTVIPDSDGSFHGVPAQALPSILGPSMSRFPQHHVRFVGVPHSPASSLAPESYYSGSQYGDFSPEDNLVFDRPSYYYSPSMMSNPRPAPRRMVSSMTEGPRRVPEGRMNAPRMAPGSTRGRMMGFPPAPASSSSIYSAGSPRVMTMRPPPVPRRRLMSEDSSFTSSNMGPSSPNMTSPYAPGPSRYRERQHIQPYEHSPSQRQQQRHYESSPLSQSYRALDRPVIYGPRHDASSSRLRSMSPESESQDFYSAEEDLESPKRKPGRQKMPGMCSSVGETPPLFNHDNFANGFTEQEMANVVWKGPPLPGYSPRIEMPINNRRGPVGRTRGGVGGHNNHFRRIYEMSTPHLPQSPRFEAMMRPRFDPEVELYEQGPEQLPGRRRAGERVWTVEDLRSARARIDPATLAEMDRLDEEEELHPPEEEAEAVPKRKTGGTRKGKGRGGGPGSRGGKIKGAGGRGASTAAAKVSKPKAKGKEKEKVKTPAKPRKSKKAALSAEVVEAEPSEAETDEMGRQLVEAMNSEFPPGADAEGGGAKDEM